LNALVKADISNAHDHAILDEPWTYDVSSISFVPDGSGDPNGTLDLTLTKNGRTVTLRFTRAHELEIDAGFPHSYMGLEILDVSFLGWEHSQVRVQGFEPAPGVRFWAHSVARLDA
jgi:hypothetical protein